MYKIAKLTDLSMIVVIFKVTEVKFEYEILDVLWERSIPRELYHYYNMQTIITVWPTYKSKLLQ